jgi:TolB protein
MAKFHFRIQSQGYAVMMVMPWLCSFMRLLSAVVRPNIGRLKARFVILASLICAALLPISSQAELRIDITRGVSEPVPIALLDFAPASAPVANYGRDIALVVAQDLERSGLFRPLDKAAFLQDAQTVGAGQVNFADWQTINAQALVGGRVELRPDGRLSVEFRLWDVLAQQQLSGLAYTTVASNWRRIAHIIADEIYKRITGEDGYFDTRIVYISEAGPANKREKRLAIMDQDGENHRFLTDGRLLVLTPRFSPTAQEITYMSYVNGRPRVYLFNIDSGRQELLGDFPGMSFSPRFSPDGNAVVFSLAQGGNTDLYRMDLRTRQRSRLTNHPAIDTAPSYSPDGARIVFESDRGGTQQLYVMNADGSNVQRISFGQGRYATPVWSPRGDYIAFTRLYQGEFYIGVIRPDGTGERMLARDFHAEGPTWSPNGRVIMYFKDLPSGNGKRSRTARLFSVDLTGANERQVKLPRDGSDPAWSSLIP